MHIYVCVYVCVCVCALIHMHIYVCVCGCECEINMTNYTLLTRIVANAELGSSLTRAGVRRENEARTLTLCLNDSTHIDCLEE
jgi:hypothetical protein